MFTRLGGGSISGITPRPAGQSLSELATIVSGKMDKRYAEKKEDADSKELAELATMAEDNPKSFTLAHRIRAFELNSVAGEQISQSVKEHEVEAKRGKVGELLTSGTYITPQMVLDMNITDPGLLKTIDRANQKYDMEEEAGYYSQQPFDPITGKNGAGLTQEQLWDIPEHQQWRHLFSTKDLDRLIELHGGDIEDAKSSIKSLYGAAPTTAEQQQEYEDKLTSAEGIYKELVENDYSQIAQEDIPAHRKQIFEQILDSRGIEGKMRMDAQDLFGDMTEDDMAKVLRKFTIMNQMLEGSKDKSAEPQFKVATFPQWVKSQELRFEDADISPAAYQKYFALERYRWDLQNDKSLTQEERNRKMAARIKEVYGDTGGTPPANPPGGTPNPTPIPKTPEINPDDTLFGPGN